MNLPLDQWTMAKQLALWPREEWPDGWIRFKVAMVLQRPEYLRMTDKDRKAARLPVKKQEMLDFLKSRNA